MSRPPPRAHVYRQPNVVATAVAATVKWYDPVRGFGFVKTGEESPDALIPASLVVPAGHQTLPEGATVVVDIVESRKGNQVSAIHSVDLGTAAPARPARPERAPAGRGPMDRDRDRGPRPAMDRGPRSGPDRGPRPAQSPRRPAAAEGPELVGTVKWFNTTKGFGFIGPEDGSRDVFVHIKALERSGLGPLQEGQRVRLTTRQGEKGPEAVTVKAE